MISQKSTQRSFAGSVDWWLIGSYLVLVLTGLLNIYSTVHYDYPELFVWSSRACKQLIWIGTAIILALLILFVIPVRLYENGALPAYLIMFFLLVLVIFVSKDTKGSHSWFEIGPIKLQPAELSKITTSLMLANVISRMDLQFKSFREYLIAIAVLAFPMLAILGESETGSMLVYVGFIFMLYREGISGWWLSLLGIIICVFVITLSQGIYWAILLCGIVGTLVCRMNANEGRQWTLTSFIMIPLLIAWPYLYEMSIETTPDSIIRFIKPLYVIGAVSAVIFIRYIIIGIKQNDRFRLIICGAALVCIAMSFSVRFIFDEILREHQQKRIEVLLGITEDPSGWGYNVHQSKIAIGSGGLTGKGWLNGTQSTFGFVPEQSTDFIFCTIGEEWGFLGCTFVILLYCLLIYRIIHCAELSRERFTRVYGYCVASCLFMHLIINVGMTIGIMPVIGIPLPLVSYGGSSLWAFTILIFIFVALYRNERKYF